jgi:tRNA modification GTPase
VTQSATRAAIITPPGEGGIGIIALTGPDASQVLEKVFVGTKRSARALAVGSIAHGTIRRNGAVVDEVIVVRLAPEDGAADDMRFEVNCHGGVAAVRSVLKCLEEAGGQSVDARALTARHFYGAAPLTDEAIRAEALAALPRARTRLAATMLLRQAAGASGLELREIEEILAAGQGGLAARRLDALLRTALLGRALLKPPKVALLGPPNVGKSTLLNTFLEEERMIVHHEPGTTRDVVAETVSLHGVPFELTDSAGIREAQDELEQLAVSRAADLARTCDIALLVFDARQGPETSMPLMPALKAGARLILVGNKVDLLPGDPAQPATWGGSACSPVIYISARNGTGIDRLEAALLEPYAELIENCRRGGPILFSEEAEQAIARVRRELSLHGPAAARAALQALRK